MSPPHGPRPSHRSALPEDQNFNLHVNGKNFSRANNHRDLSPLDCQVWDSSSTVPHTRHYPTPALLRSSASAPKSTLFAILHQSLTSGPYNVNIAGVTQALGESEYLLELGPS